MLTVVGVSRLNRGLTKQEDSDGLFFDFFLAANIFSYSSADSRSLFVGFRNLLLSAFPKQPHINDIITLIPSNLQISVKYLVKF